MTSIIKVDNIQNSSGTSSMSIASNGFVIPPAGGIIQTQYTQIDATSQWTTNANTDKAITSLAVNITPTSTNSIIKLEAMVNGEWGSQGAIYNSAWFFFRDSTKLGTTQSGSTTSGILMGTALTYEASDTSSTPEHANYMYFDSPSSTSQITYTVGVITSSQTYWYLNRCVTATAEKGMSVITATEIAG